MEKEKIEVVENDSVVAITANKFAPAYCSFTANTKEEKAKLFKALTNPDYKIGDCINKTILVKDIFAEIVESYSEEDKEMRKCTRVVLFDKDGKTYQSVSSGIAKSLQRLLTVFGEPSTWEGTLPLTIKQIPYGKGKMLTFEVEY